MRLEVTSKYWFRLSNIDLWQIVLRTTSDNDFQWEMGDTRSLPLWVDKEVLTGVRSWGVEERGCE